MICIEWDFYPIGLRVGAIAIALYTVVNDKFVVLLIIQSKKPYKVSRDNMRPEAICIYLHRRLMTSFT